MSHGKALNILHMSSSTVVNLHLALLVGSLAYEDEDDYVDTCSLPVSIKKNISVSNWADLFATANSRFDSAIPYARVYWNVRNHDGHDTVTLLDISFLSHHASLV